jgi:hypothetical protein
MTTSTVSKACMAAKLIITELLLSENRPEITQLLRMLYDDFDLNLYTVKNC